MHARVALLVAGLAAVPASWPVTAGAVPPQLRSTPTVPADTSPTVAGPRPAGSTTRAAAPAAWDTVSADLIVRRQLVRKDGAPGLLAPEMRYRWVRTLGDTGWKTTLTLVSASADRIETSKGPQAVSRKIPISRIEIGDPRTPARVFDTEGRLVFMPPSNPRTAPPGATASPDAAASLEGTGADPLALPDALRAGLDAPDDVMERADRDATSRDWVEHLLPSAAGRAARRAALLRGHGSPQGMVNGLERFVSRDGGTTTEVLSDPSWAVPVEINVIRDGALVSHSTLTYAEDPGAGLVRRRIRSELLVAPESGDRAVIDVELANLRLDRGVK
jgi:hypothetical protein